MSYRKSNPAAIRICSLLLLACAVTTVDAQVLRKKNAPVQSTPAPETRPADTRLPTGLVTPSPAGPFETRDEEQPPKITPNPNPVSFPVYIAKGQTERTAYVSWDDGPDHEYCEIFLSINGGEEAEFGRGEQGTKPLTVKLGGKYGFRMVVYSDDKGGNPTTIANLALTGQAKPSGSGVSVVVRPRPVENLVAYIEDAQATPTASAVAITFWTFGGVTPTVEIGKAAPMQAGSRWVFPIGASAGQGTALAPQRTGPLSKKVGTLANTFYKFDSNQANLRALEPGTTYYYVITIPGRDAAGDHQTTGRFITLSQTVKVVFERIDVIDDSDELSSGEIAHWYWVNFGRPTAQGAIRSWSQMSSGRSYDLNLQFVIEDAPKFLSLSASAHEDDNAADKSSYKFIPPPLAGLPVDGSAFNKNVASDEWDLRRFSTAPGETYRHGFKLVSKEGGKLQFEVYGYWELTRSAVR